MSRLSRRNRKLGWRPDLPDQRDFMLSLPTKRLPKIVSLEEGFGDFGVYDQGNLGSCTANAIAGAIMHLQIKHKKTDKSFTLPSRLFIYYGEREIEGSIDSDAGAELRDGLKVVAKQGYPQESLWPYKISTFTTKPDASVYKEAKKDHIQRYYRVNQTVQAMRLCLAHGYPFVFGFSVYTSFFDNNSGEVQSPSISDGLEGGHAVLATGYNDNTKRINFRNSWGKDWGKNGSGTIPYSYLTDSALAGDFWTIRKETNT